MTTAQLYILFFVISFCGLVSQFLSDVTASILRRNEGKMSTGRRDGQEMNVAVQNRLKRNQNRNDKIDYK